MGTRSKYVMHYPIVPNVWPIKEGTNLSQAEVDGLESAGFMLEEDHLLPSKGIEGDKEDVHPPKEKSSDAFHWSNPIYAPSEPVDGPRPPKASGDYRPTMRDGKKSKNVSEPSPEHVAKFVNSITTDCSVVKYVKVPYPGYGVVYTIHTAGSIAKQQLYEVTIGELPAGTDLDFRTMKTKAMGRGQEKWT